MHTLSWLVVAIAMFLAAAKLLSHRLKSVRWWWLAVAIVLGAIVGTLVDGL